MTVTITIRCDNAAFRDDDDIGDNEAARAAEVARILRTLASELADGVYEQSVFDLNGNKVGAVSVSNGGNDEQTAANACLIAAAPELLELCRKAFDRFTNNDMMPPNEALQGWLDGAKAALDKANGE